ncbi:TerC family protein [Cohnella sp. GCM10027633]|uniref:TerC family protein n=1 Tax=unclassified Cohnella TaxID=2636738 RepID=UPI00363489F1
MDLLSLDFWSALVAIVFFDLLLAGDNAIVIGMAARNLSKEHQKKAIIWGTAGAITIRIIATFLVLWGMLEIPYLVAVGGVLLVWIAYKMLIQENDHGDIHAGATLGSAIRTIVIADAAMGLDNVMAIAGMAQGQHGSYVLVVLGLLISIPIVVWGSTLFIKIIEKFKWIIYIGAGILAFTAAKMITHEEQFKGAFEDNPVLTWTFISAIAVLVLVAGVWTNALKSRNATVAPEPVKLDGKAKKPALATKKSRETH